MWNKHYAKKGNKMKIFSDKYDKCVIKLNNLEDAFDEVVHQAKAFQDAISDVDDEHEEALLILELGKLMDAHRAQMEDI